MAVVSVMPTSQQADPAQALAERLAEPRTAAALNTVLDHADLLALLITGLDDLVGRSDTITNSLAESVGELRAAGEPAVVNAAQVIELASILSRAATAGAMQANQGDLRVTGIVGLVRALKDPDVSRAIGFVISIARALGKELKQLENA